MQRLPTVLLLVALALVWVVGGVNTHVLTKKCYESRHSIDREPTVAPGVTGLAIDVLFWPLNAIGNIADPPDCLPRSLGR